MRHFKFENDKRFFWLKVVRQSATLFLNHAALQCHTTNLSCTSLVVATEVQCLFFQLVTSASLTAWKSYLWHVHLFLMMQWMTQPNLLSLEIISKPILKRGWPEWKQFHIKNLHHQRGFVFTLEKGYSLKILSHYLICKVELKFMKFL